MLTNNKFILKYVRPSTSLRVRDRFHTNIHWTRLVCANCVNYYYSKVDKLKIPKIELNTEIQIIELRNQFGICNYLWLHLKLNAKKKQQQENISEKVFYKVSRTAHTKQSYQTFCDFISETHKKTTFCVIILHDFCKIKEKQHEQRSSIWILNAILASTT